MDQLPTETVNEIPSGEISIEELRGEIDRLDEQIIAAVQRRSAISQLIDETRMKEGGPKLVHSREIKVLDRYSGVGPDGHGLGMIILQHSRGRLGR